MKRCEKNCSLRCKDYGYCKGGIKRFDFRNGTTIKELKDYEKRELAIKNFQQGQAKILHNLRNGNKI